MTPAVVALVLCAAILHATWNAVLRSGADRLWSITVMSLAMTVVALPFAVLLPLPAAPSWSYLFLSAGLQVGYSVFLVLTYRHAELGQAYPIVRGSVPLLVTLGAAVFAGEHLTALSLSGIALVSFGIMSLAAKSGTGKRSVAAALVTGLFIASYTVTDGMGARLAGNAQAYAAWLCLIYGVLMPLVFVAVRGRLIIDRRSPETLRATIGGIISLLGYAVVIWAMTLGPIGPVSALRETSIVFAALIGRVFLNEALTIRRLAACLGIAAGAFCLGYHP